jgi:hypothetical protein
MTRPSTGHVGTWVSSTEMADAFSVLHSIETDYGYHPAYYLTPTKASFHGCKATGHEDYR